ncbi:exo-alpha-sialidase [Ekhidna sp. To15]|uniref:exo-alpha-sialidase n=1 Tax=Ekhidna sp. To15 TaxID=3395267 RepID=UPI003F5248A1
MKLRYLLLALIISQCSQPKEETSIPSQEVPGPTGANSSLPYLIRGEDENLYISWIEKADSNQIDFKFSILQGESWSDPELIAKGDNWFVNWADYPMIAVDQEGNKIAHYLAKSAAGTYSYDVNVVIKAKDSSLWSRPLVPHTDGTPTEHGFVTMLPNNDDSFTLAWLDGRNTGGSDHSDHGNGGAMTMRTAVIDMQGNLSQENELDGRVCDCCQTGGAMTSDGPVFVYRDRSVDEVRDMAYVSKINSEWMEPKLVAMDNWSIAGCPVNGPRMDAADSTIAVAWYTAALSQPKIKVAFIGNEDFETPIIIDETSPVGRVDLVMINDQTAAVSWLDGGNKPAIKYRTVNKNGSMSPVYVVAETSEERGSGFPQMEYHDNALYFAWTEMGDVDQIRLKKITLD